MVQVSLKRVCKVYPGDVVALHEVSLEVAPGQVLVLAGPSGSGKTTLLRLVAGLETPTSGEILLDGAPDDKLPAHRRGVSLLSQRAVLYPHLSVRDNLRFGMSRITWWSRGKNAADEERIRQLADLLGIGDLLDRRPGELSGGQRQRVALGRALVRRSRLLLLDEPFASLDGPLREELRPQLHLLQRHLAATMMVVTHEQDEAVGLADRIAVFEAGRLMQVGTPREVAMQPATTFAAWLLRGRSAGPPFPFDANTGLGSRAAPKGDAIRPE